MCNLECNKNVLLFHAVQYKLVTSSGPTQGTDGGGPANYCRAECSKQGLVLMPLDNRNNLQHVVKLPNYDYTKVVYTDGIETFANGSATIFTSPRGVKVDFVNIVGTFGANRTASQNLCVVIYYAGYYARSCNKDSGYVCACKAKGELEIFFVFSAVVTESTWYKCKPSFIPDHTRSFHVPTHWDTQCICFLNLPMSICLLNTLFSVYHLCCPAHSSHSSHGAGTTCFTCLPNSHKVPTAACGCPR